MDGPLSVAEPDSSILTGMSLYETADLGRWELGMLYSGDVTDGWSVVVWNITTGDELLAGPFSIGWIVKFVCL